MSEVINLATILGATDSQNTAPQQAPRQESRQISVDYLSALNDLVGPKSALAIATKYSPKDISRIENRYDEFKFDTQPKTPKGKLQRILKFLEWEKEFSEVVHMGYYMENITESFSGFETLVNKLIATGNKEVMNFNPFIRDQLNGVARNLLLYYGEELTDENKKTGHVARIADYTPKKVVPGISTDELVDFLIAKKLANTPACEYSIVPGFDDAKTALEVSVMTNHPSLAEMYVRNGFTSLSQIQTVSLDKLKKIEEEMQFRGKLNSETYHQKNYRRFVGNYIRGNPQRVDEILALAQAGGQEYLVAFDGSVRQTQRILKILEEERPSASAIQYARDVLKVHEFKAAVALAKEIDSPYKKVFEQEFTTKEEFLAFRDDYQATLDDFIEKTGIQPDDNGKISRFSYDDIKAFKGDLRFFSDNFSTGNLDQLAKIESVMDFETYQSLNISAKPTLIPILIDNGYTVQEMQEAFSGKPKVDGYQLARYFEKLKVNIPLIISLIDIIDVIATGVTAQYASDMLVAVPFNENGIPYGVLSSLQSHEVTPSQFKSFIQTVGVSRYQPSQEELKGLRSAEANFDAVSMIRDFKTFYNQKE
ncbi:MAG: hypothetical protein ACMXYG_05370 [Candidatus Woesearchaeota archaeon]